MILTVYQVLSELCFLSISQELVNIVGY